MNQAGKANSEEKSADTESNAGLESIINEIEALQTKPPGATESSKKRGEPPPMEHPSVLGEEPWLEETLAHLKESAELTDEELVAAALEDSSLIKPPTAGPLAASGTISETHPEFPHESLAESSHEASHEELHEEPHEEPHLLSTDEIHETHEPHTEHERESMNTIHTDSDALAEHDLIEGGVLEMTIQGKMVLKLNQGKPGQHLTLRFDSDCLQILLSDGMEFKIPMKSTQARKAA